MKLPKLSLAVRGILLTLAVAISFSSYWLGRNVTISEQIAIYQVLQNVSGIMFAVFGLWIGLLYPELRKRVFERCEKQSATVESEDSSKVADHLLLPFFLSLFILLLTLFVIVFAPLLRQMPILEEAKGSCAAPLKQFHLK